MSLTRSKIVRGWLLLPMLSVLLLAGCESDSNNVFVDSVVASFVSMTGDLVINAGKSTNVAITLNERAPKDISVELLTLQDPPGSFEVPSSVTVRSGDSVAVFEVTALNKAQKDDRVEIRIVPGAAYTVGSPSQVNVRVNSPARPAVGLVGPDATVDPGEGFFYNVERTECQAALTVPLVVTGDVDCFSVPESVTLASGACTQWLSGSAKEECSQGAIEIWILPPPGYISGIDTSSRVTIASP
jgi:hypothetical protein